MPGDPTPNPSAKIVPEEKQHFTVWHEIILRPGDQYIIAPELSTGFRPVGTGP